MPTPFTLHIRLTHACQAKCTYCSSWKKPDSTMMSVEGLSSSLDFVEKLWGKLGIAPTFLNIEYVGGEVLLVPHDQLRQMVHETRARFEGKGIVVRDGAQSNLLGSERRIDELLALFDGRVGTSVDNFTGQRQLYRTDKNGKRYKVFMFHVEQYIDKSHHRVLPAVLTIDGKNVALIGNEYEIACERVRDLVLRPVFSGCSPVEELSAEALGEALANLFDRWIGDSMPIRVSPFAELLRRRCSSHSDGGMCAWQADCAKKSMSLEPNGDLYLCQEMADSGLMALGNALEGRFNDDTYELIASRADQLNKGCLQCPYFDVCQGGCLQQSLEAGNGVFGSTRWCTAWKILFERFDFWIETLGRDRLLSRLNHLDER